MGNWIARHEDPGETEGQVDSLERKLSDYIKELKPDAAAGASTFDIHEELKPKNGGE